MASEERGVRFEVGRASQFSTDEGPPCEGAVRGKAAYHLSNGVSGMQDVWYIELADLTALLAFREKHGKLILDISAWDKQTPSITIYDDYVE